MANNLATERLRELLSYDPATGLFTWRAKHCKKVIPGAVAGSKTSGGYIELSLDGVRYLAHRVAWFWMTGQWPSVQIDHEDRDRSNNRFSNLREATNAQNGWNKSALSNSKSGLKGVSWNSQSSKWDARIMADQKQKCLGAFDQFCFAIKARRAAEIELHGKYSRRAA